MRGLLFIQQTRERNQNTWEQMPTGIRGIVAIAWFAATGIGKSDNCISEGLSIFASF